VSQSQARFQIRRGEEGKFREKEAQGIVWDSVYSSVTITGSLQWLYT
jgi:hypothetical protein